MAREALEGAYCILIFVLRPSLEDAEPGIKKGVQS